MQRSVNRSLDDPAIDDIDHALGRPKNPIRESYRNYYCTGANGDLAKAMRDSDWWEENGSINEGRDVIFQVTRAGRLALANYLVDHPAKI